MRDDEIKALESFVADAVARHPIQELYVFGSRSPRETKPTKVDSDWDVFALVEPGSNIQRIATDESLGRHFATGLDLIVFDYSTRKSAMLRVHDQAVDDRIMKNDSAQLFHLMRTTACIYDRSRPAVTPKNWDTMI